MKTIRLAAILVASTLTAFSSIAIGNEAPNGIGATDGYGIIVRKQGSTKRVVFQPLSGNFTLDAEVKIYDPSAQAICTGRISGIYTDEIYSVLDKCGKFDELMPGYGVAINGESSRMLEIYRNRGFYEAIVREREWDRHPGVPIDLGEERFDKMVKNSTMPVLVEFYATWCPQCTKFASVLGKISRDFSGKVRVATINAEKNKNLSNEYNVKKYPSLFLLKDGKVIDSWTGAYKTKSPAISRIYKKLK